MIDSLWKTGSPVAADTMASDLLFEDKAVLAQVVRFRVPSHTGEAAGFSVGVGARSMGVRNAGTGTVRASSVRSKAAPDRASASRFLRQIAQVGEVPSLSSTLVQMEMLVDRRPAPFTSDIDIEGYSVESCSLDLGAVSELVLSDLGATLQILRLAGSEFDLAEERPRSIAHCIANFSTATWLDAISAPPFARDGNYAIAASLWEHSRAIAQSARVVALSMPGVNPDTAYLAGLLHDIGRLPEVLGWNFEGSGLFDTVSIGTILAQEWSLPQFVIDAIGGQFVAGCDSDRASAQPTENATRLHLVARTGQRNQWAEILSSAHELAAQLAEPESKIASLQGTGADGVRPEKVAVPSRTGGRHASMAGGVRPRLQLCANQAEGWSEATDRRETVN